MEKRGARPQAELKKGIKEGGAELRKRPFQGVSHA